MDNLIDSLSDIVAAEQIRVTLAATLAGSYGIYGPAFELCETAAHAGSEERVEEQLRIERHLAGPPGSG